MKILILGLNFAPELIGVGKYTGEMAAWLAEQGHEVRVITAPPYYPAWKISDGYSTVRYREESFRQMSVLRCPLWVPKTPTTLRRILHLCSFALSSLAPAVWQGLTWRPDIVWTVEPTAFTAPNAWLAARVGDATACLHIQDLEVEAALGLRMLSRSWLIKVSAWAYGVLLRRFDHVSTISLQMREQLPSYGVQPKRCGIFHNWVDMERIRPLGMRSPYRTELGLDDDTVVALYSGNMGGKQGVDSLAEVARLCRDIDHLHFVFAGDGSLRDQVEASTRDLDNVTMMPLQPDERFNELLNLADIHLLPQRPHTASFALPSKFGGMLASARPAVIQAEEGELARVGRTCGLVVRPGETEAMAQAVRKLTLDTERRKELGEAARRYALAHLGKEHVLNRHVEQMHAAIARRANRRPRWQRFLGMFHIGNAASRR
ncbi:MAG: WcaI family glycosyltransferase [Pseudomonadota bacterium]